jgi:hypothetical protein
MTDRFRLSPIQEHPNWEYSITRKAVFIFANDEPEARRRVANTLYNHEAVQPPLARYQKITYAISPWEVDDVTSCEVDTSSTTGYMNYVWADDDEKWPIKY